jgi:hypothetical protein
VSSERLAAALVRAASRKDGDALDVEIVDYH